MINCNSKHLHLKWDMYKTFDKKKSFIYFFMTVYVVLLSFIVLSILAFFMILSSLVMAYMVLKFVCASSPADTQVCSRTSYFYLQCLCLCPLC